MGTRMQLSPSAAQHSAPAGTPPWASCRGTRFSRLRGPRGCPEASGRVGADPPQSLGCTLGEGQDHKSALPTGLGNWRGKSPRGRAAAHLGGDHDAGVDQEAHGEAWGGPCPAVHTSGKLLVRTNPPAAVSGLCSSHPGWPGAR